MNLIALLVSLIVGFQLSCGPIAFAAAELTATNNGVQGQAKCNKIGGLILADGLAIMNGTTIEITAKGPDGHQQSQLKGKILKAQQGPNGVSGMAVFEEGLGLGSLAGGSCAERVDLNDGTHQPGPITQIGPESVTAGGNVISMSQIAAIHSGHVFNFSANSANKLNFAGTCVKAPEVTKVKSKSSSNFGGKQVIIGLVVAAVIATAIAVPIAVATHGHGHHNTQTTQSSGSASNPSQPPSGPVNTAGGFRGGRPGRDHSSTSSSSTQSSVSTTTFSPQVSTTSFSPQISTTTFSPQISTTFSPQISTTRLSPSISSTTFSVVSSGPIAPSVFAGQSSSSGSPVNNLMQMFPFPRR